MENQKQCHFNQNSFCIEGEVPEEMRTIIDMFNTWSRHFMLEWMDGHAYRYNVNGRDSFYMDDNRKMCEELLMYCNGEKGITLGMMALADTKHVIEFKRKTQQYVPYTIAQTGLGYNPEFTFYMLAKKLNLSLSITALSEGKRSVVLSHVEKEDGILS